MASRRPTGRARGDRARVAERRWLAAIPARDRCNLRGRTCDAPDSACPRHWCRGLPTTGGPGARLSSRSRFSQIAAAPCRRCASRPAPIRTTGRPRQRTRFLRVVMRMQCPDGSTRDSRLGTPPRIRDTLDGLPSCRTEHFHSGGACDGAPSPPIPRTPGAPSSGRSARSGPGRARVGRASTTGLGPDLLRPGGCRLRAPADERISGGQASLAYRAEPCAAVRA